MLNSYLRALALSLGARGEPDPLRQFYRMADLWLELCLLTGLPVPEDVAAVAKEDPFSGLRERPKEET